MRPWNLLIWRTVALLICAAIWLVLMATRRVPCTTIGPEAVAGSTIRAVLASLLLLRRRCLTRIAAVVLPAGRRIVVLLLLARLRILLLLLLMLITTGRLLVVSKTPYHCSRHSSPFRGDHQRDHQPIPSNYLDPTTLKWRYHLPDCPLMNRHVVHRATPQPSASGRQVLTSLPDLLSHRWVCFRHPEGFRQVCRQDLQLLQSHCPGSRHATRSRCSERSWRDLQGRTACSVYLAACAQQRSAKDPVSMDKHPKGTHSTYSQPTFTTFTLAGRVDLGRAISISDDGRSVTAHCSGSALGWLLKRIGAMLRSHTRCRYGGCCLGGHIPLRDAGAELNEIVLARAAIPLRNPIEHMSAYVVGCTRTSTSHQPSGKVGGACDGPSWLEGVDASRSPAVP